LSLSLQTIKAFRFAWTAVPGITHYKLLEDPTGTSGFTQVRTDINASATSLDHIVPLHLRLNARYIVQACAATQCTDSNTVSASGSLAGAVGYLKAASSSAFDQFGAAVALSSNGSTLAVGVPLAGGNAADSGAVYVFVRNGEEAAWVQQAFIEAASAREGDRFGTALALDSAGVTLAVGATLEDGTNSDSGAVYVFQRSGGIWTEQAVLKASHPGLADTFGAALSLSGDGRSLAVGAPFEDGGGVGTAGDPSDDSIEDAGAAYVFVKEAVPGGFAWRQDTYLKASNPDKDDRFGGSIALSADGATLAVGARFEDSSAEGSGAVYVFVRAGQWVQQAFIKASNVGDHDEFGTALDLSADGSTLAVGANFAAGAGAAYVLVRSGGTWTQQAFLQASDTSGPGGDSFGLSLALSADGSLLAVGAPLEDSSARGIDGDDSDNSAEQSGATYVFERANDAWAQRAYVKPSNTASGYLFGIAVELSGDGATLAAGAIFEPGSPAITAAGAVYLY
jgi:hypothetical protein